MTDQLGIPTVEGRQFVVMLSKEGRSQSRITIRGEGKNEPGCPALARALVETLRANRVAVQSHGIDALHYQQDYIILDRIKPDHGRRLLDLATNKLARRHAARAEG